MIDQKRGVRAEKNITSFLLLTFPTSNNTALTMENGTVEKVRTSRFEKQN